MKFGSVCSGIEAASMAWNPLGWKAQWFSEIEAFPSAVLAQRHPGVPNLGDMTKFKEWPDAAIDVLVGGTPCQSFSVAGLRKGLADPRGNLMLTYLAIADKYRPKWLVWENVPGVLSSGGGKDFGTFLGGLGELGYGFAYRVLDAQFFGVPQRRRRVFVVGCLGDWRRAAAVLFERHSLSGHPAPRREAGKSVAGTIKGGSGSRGYPDPSDGNGGGLIAAPHADISPAIKARDSKGASSDGDGDGAILVPMVAPTLNAGGNSTGGDRQYGMSVDTADSLIPIVTHPLRADGFDASEDGTGRGTPLVPVEHVQVMPTLRAAAAAAADGPGHGARSGDSKDEYIVPMAFDTTQITSPGNYSTPQPGDASHPLAAGAHAPAIAFGWQNSAQQGASASASITPTLDKSKVPGLSNGKQVRRLTPRECERLQGFRDDYTLIPVRGKPAADGPRYKALGNSMAVPVMAWIGSRIQMVEDLT